MFDSLHIYNTLSGTKEAFAPLNPPRVGMYVCGPTVYSNVQIGNIRSFLTFDIVFRYLMHLGYQVRYVRNITDVGHMLGDEEDGEGRFEKRAKLEKLEPMEVVQKYMNDFHEVASLFNLLPPSIEPTATGHIVEQIEVVQQILDAGFAYEVNGSVYFDVQKYSRQYDYGHLSGRKLEDLLENTRSELQGGQEKRFFADFALWKAASPKTLMKWPSPWSVGVPGWHLECSVMSTKYLGAEFDIHGGGMDLKFPHHECEIAQSSIANGVAPVRYWMHGNMLNMGGEKMSKSIGNFILPKELCSGEHTLLDKGYSPLVARFFMLQTHYRSTLEFSLEALQAAEVGFKRLMKGYELALQLPPCDTHNEADDEMVLDLIKKVGMEMNDDFNTPKVIAVLFDLVSVAHKIKAGQVHLSQAVMENLKDTLKDYIEDVLGIHESTSDLGDQKFGDLMDLVLEIRADAKSQKNWGTADLIRSRLGELGIQVKDSTDGSSWEFK